MVPKNKEKWISNCRAKLTEYVFARAIIHVAWVLQISYVTTKMLRSKTLHFPNWWTKIVLTIWNVLAIMKKNEQKHQNYKKKLNKEGLLNSNRRTYLLHSQTWILKVDIQCRMIKVKPHTISLKQNIYIYKWYSSDLTGNTVVK
jgi:hypothetical protein